MIVRIEVGIRGTYGSSWAERNFRKKLANALPALVSELAEKCEVELHTIKTIDQKRRSNS